MQTLQTRSQRYPSTKLTLNGTPEPSEGKALAVKPHLRIAARSLHRWHVAGGHDRNAAEHRERSAQTKSQVDQRIIAVRSSLVKICGAELDCAKLDPNSWMHNLIRMCRPCSTLQYSARRRPVITARSLVAFEQFCMVGSRSFPSTSEWSVADERGYRCRCSHLSTHTSSGTLCKLWLWAESK